MKHLAWAAALLLLAPMVLASTHADYSSPRAGFSAVTSVSVDDTAVYKTGYVSENGSQWTAFTLTGEKERSNWVLGTASSDVSLENIRYVAIFSCTWNDAWDCSQTWQVRDRGPQTISGEAVVYPDTARDIQPTSATIRGWIRDYGADEQARVWLEWREQGTTDWTQTPEQDHETGWPFTHELQGLTPDTEYEYRAYARTNQGTSQSMTQTFRTHKQVTSGSVQTDRAALMDLYQATGGESWTNNDGWGGSADTMGSWHGVTTYSSGPDAGRVKEIRLKDNNLAGQIPASFGDLSKLTHLRVKGNSLTGPIDTFLCDLESAQWLSLSSFTSVNGQNDRDIDDYVRFNHEGKNGDGQNGFTGTLPECIQDMTSLRMLEVAASHLTGELPAHLPPNINAVFIQSNDLGGPLPPGWGEASSLTHLYINQNFRDTKYTGPIPPEWNGMQQMRWFTAKGNEFTGPLPVMDQWHDVRLFAIGGPPIGGEFPFWLMTDPDKHRSLHTMEIGGTHFTGQLPAHVSPYFDPSTFSIMNNDLTGPIPHWFEEQFKSTVQILWAGNSFSGEFPDVSDFSQLRFIEVAGNEFSGELPEVDPNNPTLNIVTFSGNDFSGTIPSSWGQLADGMFERGMRIQDNEIEGPIPTRLGETVKNRFHVENNKFVFADLIPVVQEMRSHSDFEDPRGVNYAPQKPFGHAQTTTTSAGEAFTYDYSAKSHPDDSYQWTKDGAPISGATSASITISDLEASDAGEYRLEISNPFGSVEDGDGQTLGTLVSEPITLQVTEEATDSKAGDEDALEALYVATNGDSWTDNTGWSSSGMDLNDEIHGVTTQTINGEPRVTQLDLHDNGLTGSIDIPELGNLKQMRLFTVTFNDLYSQVPASLGQATNLEYLYLSRADPGDQGMKDTYPHVFALQPGGGDVHVGKNKGSEQNIFYGPLPASLGNLQNLKWFILNWADSAIGAADGISSVPPELFSIDTMVGLQIFNNNNIADLPFPESICDMTNLDNLALGVEKSGRDTGYLTGTVPSCFSDLSNLRHLRLGENTGLTFDFDTIDLTNLQKLRNFGGQKVDFRGQFPTEVLDGSMPKLIGFSTSWPSGQGVTGTIPSGSTDWLQIFGVRNNDMHGEIPASFWNNCKLILLDLSMNNFTTIGTDDLTNLGACSFWRIRNLRWADNNIQGSWPHLDWTNKNNLDRHPLGDFSRFEVGNNSYVFRDMLHLSDDGRTLFDWYQQEAESLFSYRPQKPFGEPRSISTSTGADLVLDDFTDDVSHADNQYQWRRDGSSISGATSREHTLNDVQASDAGEYTLQVTNPGVPDLTLTSEPITINIS